MMLGWWGEALAVALGLVLGSYAVTASLRLARRQPSTLGRSHCDACGASLSFADTVPVVSYVGLRGACASCGARIDPLHVAGELAGAVVLAGAAALRAPVSGALAAALGLCLLATAAVDIKIRRLPNAFAAAVALLGAILALRRSLEDLLIGGGFALGLGAALQGLRVVRQRLGQDPGLGFGDVKLIAAASLWLGVAAPWMLLVAALVGLLAMVIVRPADHRLAFGPAIAVATWTVGMIVELGLWPRAI